MSLRVHARNQHGFTLTELIVACAIIGFVMAGLFSILQSGQQSYLVGTNQVEAQQSLRLAVQRMSNEIRDAGFCPTCGTGSPPVTPFAAITSASSTGFTIQNDWNGSWNGTSGIAASGTVNYVVVGSTGTATTTQRGEKITYTYSSSAKTLTRQETGVDGSAQTLVSNLDSLSFTYLNAAGTVITSPVPAGSEASIRTIVINAVGQPLTQPSTAQSGRVKVAMTDTVRLRNRIP
jgi:prepilin-type N-terminal cleavage/methylation domain-containing protein